MPRKKKGEGEGAKLAKGDEVTYQGKPCRVTAVHENGNVDLEPIDASSWYRDVSVDQLGEEEEAE